MKRQVKERVSTHHNVLAALRVCQQPHLRRVENHNNNTTTTLRQPHHVDNDTTTLPQPHPNNMPTRRNVSAGIPAPLHPPNTHISSRHVAHHEDDLMDTTATCRHIITRRRVSLPHVFLPHTRRNTTPHHNMSPTMTATSRIASLILPFPLNP